MSLRTALEAPDSAYRTCPLSGGVLGSRKDQSPGPSPGPCIGRPVVLAGEPGDLGADSHLYWTEAQRGEGMGPRAHSRQDPRQHQDARLAGAQPGMLLLPRELGRGWSQPTAAERSWHAPGPVEGARLGPCTIGLGMYQTLKHLDVLTHI